MSNQKPPIELDIITTADGSPTLMINGGEKMHSMDGALSESVYIYGPCIENTFMAEKPAILSMGLGLAYNELLALGMLLKEKKENFTVLSFEKEKWLIDNFIAYVMVDSSEFHTEAKLDLKLDAKLDLVTHNNVLKNKLYFCYQQVIERVSEALGINKTELLLFTRNALEKEQLILSGSLNLKNSFSIKFNGILYDAFSGQTDKDLWSAQTLNAFIDNYCHETLCTFSTYAATGDLNRSLKAQGFSLKKMKGYGKKRESTFAFRNLNPA